MKFVRAISRCSPRLARRVLPYIAAFKLYNSVEQINYRCDSEKALRKAGLYSERVARQVDLLRMRFIADQMFLENAKLADVASMSPSLDDEAKFLAVQQLIAGGRPILFGCSYFGCMFFALLALGGLVDDLLIVTAADPGPGLRLFEKIALASGIRMTVIGATEPLVAVRILRQLKQGGAVATMLDCFYGTASDLHTDFLGRPAASLGTLYGLAKRADAVVVPTASIRRDGKQFLDVGELIDLQSIAVEDASLQVNDYFSNLIRIYPDQWMGWQNLLSRWDMARP